MIVVFGVMSTQSRLTHQPVVEIIERNAEDESRHSWGHARTSGIPLGQSAAQFQQIFKTGGHRREDKIRG